MTSPELCSYWSSTSNPFTNHLTSGCGRPTSGRKSKKKKKRNRLVLKNIESGKRENKSESMKTKSFLFFLSSAMFAMTIAVARVNSMHNEPCRLVCYIYWEYIDNWDKISVESWCHSIDCTHRYRHTKHTRPRPFECTFFRSILVSSSFSITFFVSSSLFHCLSSVLKAARMGHILRFIESFAFRETKKKALISWQRSIFSHCSIAIRFLFNSTVCACVCMFFNTESEWKFCLALGRKKKPIANDRKAVILCVT